MRRHRPAVECVCAVVLATTAAMLSAQAGSLTVKRQGDHLRLSAPGFHFIEGRPLEQLHNGAAVPYVFSVTIEPEKGGARTLHLRERVVVSYDLWEEKFSVVVEGQPRRAASHLTATAAEAWCLDNLGPAVSAVPAEKPFVVKLACSVADVEAPPPGSDGLTLSALIDFFSRKGAAAPPHWDLVSKPVRLADLKDTARR